MEGPPDIQTGPAITGNVSGTTANLYTGAGDGNGGWVL